MSDTFLDELRQYLHDQYKTLYDREIELNTECQQILSSYKCFGPDENDELRASELKRDADKCYAQRQVYAEIYRKVAREQELQEWLEDVQSWLPQGQTR